MEISGSVFAPDTLQPCRFLAILFPIRFWHGEQNLPRLPSPCSWASLSSCPGRWLCANSVLSSHCRVQSSLTQWELLQQCLSHQVGAGISSPLFQWINMCGLAPAGHTALPHFPKIQPWWDTSSTAQCLPGLSLQPRLRVRAISGAGSCSLLSALSQGCRGVRDCGSGRCHTSAHLWGMLFCS